MSMTPDEMIAVIQAYKEGKIIEAKSNEYEARWGDGFISWNFAQFDYRVKPEPPKPREWWLGLHHNYAGRTGIVPICGDLYPNKPNPCTAGELVHVREVLE